MAGRRRRARGRAAAAAPARRGRPAGARHRRLEPHAAACRHRRPRRVADAAPDELLRRLFWQESLHAFDHRPCRFACRCTRDKVGDMLRMLGSDEVEAILAERGEIEVRCEFCNQAYRFDLVDSVALFHAVTPSPEGAPTRH
ncbi:MAG: Hsp33 family molecular chaperone HslO [Burkholderiaceae bacterium]|nr:Hsp33 family molecular chaperone HslO [Burkholderiaceae bacterium]